MLSSLWQPHLYTQLPPHCLLRNELERVCLIILCDESPCYVTVISLIKKDPTFPRDRQHEREQSTVCCMAESSILCESDRSWTQKCCSMVAAHSVGGWNNGSTFFLSFFFGKTFQELWCTSKYWVSCWNGKGFHTNRLLSRCELVVCEESYAVRYNPGFVRISKL